MHPSVIWLVYEPMTTISESTFHITEMPGQTSLPSLTWKFYLGEWTNDLLWNTLPHCSCQVTQENCSTASFPLYCIWSWKVGNITCTTKANHQIYMLNQSYILSWVQPHKNVFQASIVKKTHQVSYNECNLLSETHT